MSRRCLHEEQFRSQLEEHILRNLDGWDNIITAIFALCHTFSETRRLRGEFSVQSTLGNIPIHQLAPGLLAGLNLNHGVPNPYGGPADGTGSGPPGRRAQHARRQHQGNQNQQGRGRRRPRHGQGRNAQVRGHQHLNSASPAPAPANNHIPPPPTYAEAMGGLGFRPLPDQQCEHCLSDQCLHHSVNIPDVQPMPNFHRQQSSRRETPNPTRGRAPRGRRGQTRQPRSQPNSRPRGPIQGRLGSRSQVPQRSNRQNGPNRGQPIQDRPAATDSNASRRVGESAPVIGTHNTQATGTIPKQPTPVAPPPKPDQVPTIIAAEIVATLGDVIPEPNRGTVIPSSEPATDSVSTGETSSGATALGSSDSDWESQYKEFESGWTDADLTGDGDWPSELFNSSGRTSRDKNWH